jgi:hypothetical protein
MSWMRTGLNNGVSIVSSDSKMAEYPFRNNESDPEYSET